MKRKTNSRGSLSIYLKWPIIAIVYLLVVTIVFYIIDVKSGTIMLIFLVPFVTFGFYLYFSKFNDLESAIQKAVKAEAKRHGLDFAKVEIPHIAFNDDGKILWANDKFLTIGQNIQLGQNISEIFPEINKNLLKSLKDERINLLTSYAEKKYKADIWKLNLAEFEDKENIKIYDANANIIIAYFYDQTEFYVLKQEYDNSKQVTGFIYIDNFEEIAESLEDSKASMLIAMVDRKLTRYMSYNKGVIKKLEKDKYFFVTTKNDIEDMIEDRFSILEQTKEIIGGDNIPLTLSIGVGYEGKSIESNHDLARVAMDMALGRGGDQAVVKKGQETLFFGGKGISNTSNAKVRSRVKASSFKETLDTKDKVLIMGHRNGDLDSFGASIGVYVMTKHLGKDAHIVINSLTNDALEMKERFINSGVYSKEVFMSGDEALNFADENTLLINVDHNLNKLSDEQRLNDLELDAVVFDHHRISKNSFTDAILTYVDPGASSTCELVTEIMIYFDDRLKIRQLEADTLLGGILVDTMSFTFQTGAKTFEAASFLKKKGADSDRIRKILRIDVRAEKIKNDAVNNAEFYKNTYAISVLSDVEGIDANVIKASIANELIGIKGVKASIVITTNDNKEYLISSRSIDEVNVQVLMEKFGGGGHRSQAGATIEANSFEEVIKRVKMAIDEMIEEERK